MWWDHSSYGGYGTNFGWARVALNAIKFMDYICDVLLFFPSPRYRKLVMQRAFVSCEGL
jgi:hypothetical protein